MKIFKKDIFLTMALFPIVFVALGILLAVIGLQNYRGDVEPVEIKATVTRCEYTVWFDADDNPQSGYDIYVDYTYQGKKYSDVYWKNNSFSIDTGESVKVKIDPEDPGNIYSSGPIVLVVVGAVFAVAGLILLYYIVPLSVSDTPSDSPEKGFLPKGKKQRLLAHLPPAAAVIFLILGICISPWFHFGTIISAYLTVVLLELLNKLCSTAE